MYEPFNPFVSHLECSQTGERYPANQAYNVSEAGYPLLVQYDLKALRDTLKPRELSAELPGFWRYSKLLPLGPLERLVSLGEVCTPLIPLSLASTSSPGGSGSRVWIKDEGILPTGSFKARGVSLAVNMAKQLGIQKMAIPTNGNAGAALAAYGAQAGLEILCYCPRDTPPINVEEMRRYGAEVQLHDGLIHECGSKVQARCDAEGWFNTSTLREPYRIEGKKTMGLELAEQFNWQLPDYIFYPTGGGTGLIGMWKAFRELKALGWLIGDLPKMICVQAKGCAPLVRAFERGDKRADVWENAETVAAGIRVPKALGDFLVLDAVRESGGYALSVTDDAICTAQHDIATKTGFLMCPEGAATAAALKQSLSESLIEPGASVVLFNCATGLKYLDPGS